MLIIIFINFKENLNISEARYLHLNDSDDIYLCPACYLKSSNESIQVTLPDLKPDTNINEAKLGVQIGDQILSGVRLAYEEIVQWKRNLFKLPTGSAGRDFLEEMIIVFNMFNSSSAMKSAAITMVIIMLPLLQKPPKSCKGKDHKVYLEKRLTLWKEDEIQELIRKFCVIERKLTQGKKKQQMSRSYPACIPYSCDSTFVSLLC